MTSSDRMTVVEADITTLDVDAIVNAANALPERVVFCCFGADSAALHTQALADLDRG